jgi:hypothetical protein
VKRLNERLLALLPDYGELPKDMDDSRETLENAALDDFLRLFGQLAADAFLTADGQAKKFQQLYKTAATAAALLGFGAVFLAILHLTRLIGEPINGWLIHFEVAAVVTAVALVIAVEWLDWKDEWILARFKAEYLRLMKFRRLLHADVWQGDEMDLG